MEQACADPKTGICDLFLHMYLRNTFTVVYVTAEDNVRDIHRNYIQGGSTEHSLFISRLHTKKYLTLIPDGHATSKPNSKGKAKAKGKMSESRKIMYALPDLNVTNGSAPAKSVDASQSEMWSLGSELPLSAAAPMETSFFHASVSLQNDEGKRCLAKTSSGRCQRGRNSGSNFCKQHENMAKGKTGSSLQDFFNSLGLALKTAKHNTYDDDLQKAKRASLDLYMSIQKKRGDNIKVIASRLRAYNAQCVEIPEEGDCQFEAVTTTAGLRLRPNELRLQACEYLA